MIVRSSLVVAVASTGMNADSGVRPCSAWTAVAPDGTALSCIYRNIGVTLMVVGQFPSTTLRENAKICPSVFVAFVNDTGRCLNPQRTRM